MAEEQKPVQHYLITEHELSASGQVEVAYAFKPDQILAYTDTPLDIGVDIQVAGSQGGGTVPLRGQGPASFPGVSENQVVVLRNLDLIDRTILLVAQKGLLPTSIVGPSVAARPSAISPISETYHRTASGTVHTFVHSHKSSGLLLVYVTLQGVAGGVTINISSVTANGQAMTQKQHQAVALGATARVTAGLYSLLDVAAGDITIVVTTSGSAQVGAWALTFDARISIGNTTGGTANAAALTITNVGQLSTSKHYAAIVVRDLGVAITEAAGADLEFRGSPTPPQGEIWSRIGKGSLAFQFASVGNDKMAAVAAELIIL